MLVRREERGSGLGFGMCFRSAEWLVGGGDSRLCMLGGAGGEDGGRWLVARKRCANCVHELL